MVAKLNQGLAPDGSYNAQAPDPENDSFKRPSAYLKAIHSYRVDRDSGKARFLKEAQSFLQAICAQIVAAGAHWHVSANPGGMAVSGEAYGFFWVDDNLGAPLLMITVCVSEGRLSPRRDGVAIMARLGTTRAGRQGKAESSKRGNAPAMQTAFTAITYWLDSNQTPAQLGKQLTELWATGRLGQVEDMSVDTVRRLGPLCVVAFPNRSENEQ